MINFRWISPTISYRVVRRAVVAGLLVVAFAWAFHRQFEVEEIHLGESPRNLPLAILRPTADDWPGAFGTAGPGRCARDRLPSELGATSRLSWQNSIPGTAEGSVCIWGDLVAIPVIEPAAGTISLWAVDRRDGNSVWKTALHHDLKLSSAKQSSQATPACDGQSFFTAVAVDGRLLVSAVDLQGRKRWVRDAGPLACENGRLLSPVLYESLVIVAGDHRGSRWPRWHETGTLTALHRLTGEIIWRVRRPNGDGLATPALVDIVGRKQIIVPAPGRISSYDPASGKSLWSCRWQGTRAANSVAWNDRLVIAASSEPRPTVAAIRADGVGDVTASHVVWQNSTSTAATITPLLFQESVVCLSEDGRLTSLETATGKLQWRRQLPGTFAMQPILAGDRLLCLNRDGTAFVVELESRGKIVSEQSLADGVSAPAAATRSQLILHSTRGLLSLPWEAEEPPLVNTPDRPRKRL